MSAAPGNDGGVTRREAIAIAAAALVASRVGVVHRSTPGSTTVPITCFIRYQIDPYKIAQFRAYAERWGRIIPKCGGHLVGYFLPDEGTNDIAWGLIAFDDLAAYERYRQRLRTDPEAVANFTFAQNERFILREERNFVRVVDGTFEQPAALQGAR